MTLSLGTLVPKTQCTYNQAQNQGTQSRASLGALVSMDSRTLLIEICLVSACGVAGADTFSFSGQAAKEQAQQDADAAARAQTIQTLVSVPCRQRLKNQRILLLVGEQSSGQWDTDQDRFGEFVRAIDKRLKGLSLKTYTQQEIKASIAQAEVDAYFKNDPDAALSASKRMGANYILRGVISSRTGVNPVVQVNEVAVNIDLTLSAADGRVLSDVSAHSDAYSGSDTLATALELVKQHADLLVAQLYNDYCSSTK
jgi:hypothetical protein